MTCAPITLLGAGILVVFGPASLAYAQTTCYVDSVAGDDTKNGSSEADAVQSRSKIASSCATVKFKRGSEFQLASGEQVLPTAVANRVKTITNYGDASLPLPKFTKTRAANNGSMISSYQGGLTIDGIYMSGSESDAQMANLGQGICVMLGANSKLINNEITDCDIGVMTTGDGSLVQNNYIHDLHISVDAAPGVDPNVVGGAEGIFVNSSNVEVAYNTFVNCSTTAAWTGGDCDGGATEVTVQYAGKVSGVKIHHNFSYNSCGFFEVSSMFQPSGSTGPYQKGLFADSTFSYNVMIDSGWISLLQVNNTDLSNIRWENNTIVHHAKSTNAGIMAVVFTSTSSGTSGGSLQPNTVFWTNNFWVFDGVRQLTPDSNFVQTTNLVINDTSKQNPGFVNLAGTTLPTDFDLLPTSPAVNYGTVITGQTLDFLNRAVPDSASGKTDVGAFEYNSTQVSQPPRTWGAGGSSASPGGTGGATTVGNGGAAGTTSPASRSGGATTPATGKGGAAGTTSPATGGTAAASPGTGGRSGGSGGAAGGGGGSTNPTAGGGNNGSGGAAQGSGGAGNGGVQSTGGAGNAGAPGAGGTTASTIGGLGSVKSGCNCRVGQGQGSSGLWLGLFAFALLRARRCAWRGRSASCPRSTRR